MPPIILTHRGLDPSTTDFYPESSYEAFADQLSRGFGIEFDPNFCKDGIVVSHDATLKRITNGRDERAFSEVPIAELQTIRYGSAKKGRIPTFKEVLELIRKSPSIMNAMHLKGKYQIQPHIDLLMEHLRRYQDIIPRILIFDVKPETVRYLKSIDNTLHLAPSVAHPYDIKRYNPVVGETLFSVNEALRFREEQLYDWVWLDEWDTADENRAEKKLYTQGTFEILRKAGYKIALVTPELHGTSPGLYGGESHKDARDKSDLFERIREILSLNPDALCTDYPEEVKMLAINI